MGLCPERQKRGADMKISTRGRYALRLMLDLALNDNGQYIKVKEIAARQGISEKYLEQIITMLSRADYVKGVRGAQGGYRLSRAPEEYTVGMILRLTEGGLAPVACLEENREACERAGCCAALELYKRIDDAIKSVIDNMTLAELVDIQRQKEGADRTVSQA